MSSAPPCAPPLLLPLCPPDYALSTWLLTLAAFAARTQDRDAAQPRDAHDGIRENLWAEHLSQLLASSKVVLSLGINKEASLCAPHQTIY